MLPTNATLRVIDVQQGFLDASWGLRNNPDAEANIGRLIAAWRRDGRFVVHIHHSSRSAAGTCFLGTAGHDPKPEATPAPGEPVYVKGVNSGFIGTALEQDLRDAGVDTLAVVGLDGGMRPAAEVHAAALSDLSEEFATIISTDDVLCAGRPVL